jgi:hypothetical protein
VAGAGSVAGAGEEGQLVLVSHRGQGRLGGWGIAGRYDHAASIRDLGGDLGRDCLGCAAISGGIVWVRGRGRGRTARCARLHTVLIE